MENCSKFLRVTANSMLEDIPPQELINLALSFKVTNSMLAELEQERQFRVRALMSTLADTHVLQCVRLPVSSYLAEPTEAAESFECTR